jgi:redox-sensitive bicupin YhaK (pirin superfamily)
MKITVIMKTTFHSADSRGHANHGWLNAKHSFSFASWYNPDRINFGALRVLNDDIVAAKMGFGTHPHDNMEIITIPLSGSLKHKDSMGNTSEITTGEVQVMSAGTGVEHSEFNPSPNVELNLFQIWIFPNKRGVEPRYDQIRYDLTGVENQFLQVLSPDPTDDGTWIHQDAWIHLASSTEGNTLDYSIKKEGNGVYIMNIDGIFEINGQQLTQRDALGIEDFERIKINTLKPGRLMVIEVPMIF